MKKLFLTICFSIIGWQIIDASAKTVAFEDMEAAQAYKASQDNLPPPPPEDDSPDPRDTRAMEKYIMERLKKATISNLGPTDSMDKPSSVNMQHSDDYIAKMNEKNKSFFERIYDEAINRISSGDCRQCLCPDLRRSAIVLLSRLYLYRQHFRLCQHPDEVPF